MGSCCSTSDTADSAESAAPPTPRTTRTTAKSPISTYTLPRNPRNDLVSAVPPSPVTPSVSAISVLSRNGMKEASWTAARAAGPPAARKDRLALAPLASQAFSTLRVVEEESSGDSDADAFSEPEPMAAKTFIINPAEIYSPPRWQQPEQEAAEQQMVGVAALTSSSSDVTPERVTAPTATPRQGGDRTHGPSTARVEEVPPTPKDENARTLPADDPRVLQRAPPPPPPPAASAASFTPKEMSLDGEMHGDDQMHQAHGEAAGNVKPEEAVAAAEIHEEVTGEEQEPNLQADITRSRKEKQRRYPSELSIDATKDAPLDISMGAGDSPPPKIAHNVNRSAHAYVNAAPEIHMGTTVVPEQADGPTSNVACNIPRPHEQPALEESPQLHGNLSDKISRHTDSVTHEQHPTTPEGYYAEGNSLMPPPCSIQQPPQAEPISQSKERELEGPPLHWETSHRVCVPPRADRPLPPSANVLWSSEHPNAPEVAAKISAEGVLCYSGSAEENAEEQGIARDLGSNANNPITFTASPEDNHPLSMDKDRIYLMGNTDLVEVPQPIVGSAVPSVALFAPREVADKPVASLELPTTSPTQAAENTASADAEAPRRMPPPLPSDRNDAARAAPLPSRPAPPSIMSPPPA
ncbi:hypothetical protein CUR178_01384 [Leishmania enriettii]|uniref:Ch34 protein n=1 Tax=Leishmania enriettii TaxID=5663 RepID=A0A836FSR0_LEIEN|nr:hypothetical protein CUR178_01384 [Leishmania enriettii]